MGGPGFNNKGRAGKAPTKMAKNGVERVDKSVQGQLSGEGKGTDPKSKRNLQVDKALAGIFSS
ncbi:MAG: hypothetical protein KAR40_07850 [Candidatus Sabulitectum sp.]|nr:hypothetical protein [Candidatus Sabulitectum sp.]